MDDDATQFSYFRDNELTQLVDAETTPIKEKYKALQEGTTFLNKYKILKVLGEGSFSLIYLLEANDVSKKLLVAKEFFPKGFVTRNSLNEVVLKTSLTEKEIENYHFMKDIFIGEAQNLVKVSKRAHPNVLNFFALEENINNTMYLITDYEEGITLKDYVKERKNTQKGKLTNQEIKDIAAELLNGLSHIHKVDVYHQDIKLENILIRQDQYPLLLDFGASVILYDEKQKKYFNATTPRYAAPEQVELSQPPTIDQRTDVYELGVLLYKLITDEFPPKANERLKAVEEHKDSYVSLEVQKPYGYDINVLKAVDRALELRQEDRFQNADDFKKALLVKKTYTGLSIIGLAFLVPFIFGLIYLFWPSSEGTAKLNLGQEKYFVYSDGKKVKLSEEKTILLSTGKHQLTIIKDGYVPHEVNITIKANHIINVYGKLAPVNHLVLLESNIGSASFTVNEKILTGNTFEGQAGQKYTITTTAPNYISERKEINYNILHKNDFKFYQKLKPAQTKVKIIVDKPMILGANSIKVKGKDLADNSMIARYNDPYIIDIENPYYEKIHFERSYVKLNKNPKQKTLLKQKVIKKAKTMQKSIEKTKTAKKEIPKPLPKIKLIKKEIIQKPQTIQRDIVKKTDVLEKTKKTKKEVKKSIKVKTVTYRIKRGDTLFSIARANRTTIEALKRQNSIKSGETLKLGRVLEVPVNTYISKIKKIKKPKIVKKKKKRVKKARKKYKKRVKKARKKYNKRKTTSRYLWYCVAGANGTRTWSAKHSTKKGASSSALRQCRRSKNSFCRVSSCYILDGL